ncbi:uncharacterized protein METZ01_LOCUS358416, partial [marine metagenome]
MFRRALISILEVTRTAARAVVVLAFATIVIVVF